jgi:CheY-like chemotaxis protein
MTTPIGKSTDALKSKNAPKKILVVNNDPQTREVFCHLLRLQGHEVVLAGTGQEGIRKFHAERFDLMLLDVHLPDTNGWNIFRTLISINPFLPIAVTERNSQHELVVFEGKTPLAALLNVPKFMQAIAHEIRRMIGNGALALGQPGPGSGLGSMGVG